MTASAPASPFRWLKRLVLLVVALLVLVPSAGYIALNSMDFTRFIPYLQQQVKEKTGRELTVGGDIQVAFGLTPSLTVGKVALSNPDWAKNPALFSAEEVTVSMELLPLLSREIAIRELSASGATVMLEKNSNGETSWALREKKAAAAPVAGKASAPAAAPAFTTRMGPVVLNDTRITYSDHGHGKDVSVTIPVLTLSTEENVHVVAELAIDGFNGSLTLDGAPLAELASKPVALVLELKGAEGASLSAKGKVKHLADTPELALALEAKAESLSAFSPLAGSALPKTERFHFAADAAGNAQELTLENLQAGLGEATATGHARLRLGEGKPLLTATIGVPSYTVSETKTAAPADAAPAAAIPEEKRVIPDIQFPAGALSALNADVEFTVGEIKTSKQTVESVMGHLVLKEGILQVDPLQFKLREELIKGHFAYNTSGKQPVMNLSFATQGQDFGAFLEALGTTEKVKGGTFSGNVTLKGQGTGLHAMLPNVSGTVSLVVEKTVLKDPKLQGATEFANLIQGKERSGDVSVNCALSKLNISEGVGTPEYLVADMKNVRVYGEGSFNLPQEALGLTFYPQPKSAGFSELNFPVKVKGSFANPEIKPDRTQAAFSVTKMFVDSKKLGGLEGLLGKGKAPEAAGKDLSGLHPCLTPIAAPQEGQATPSLKDVVGEKKEGVKEGIKNIEQDVKGLREGLKGMFKKD